MLNYKMYKIRGVFKKRLNSLNSAPTNIESALRLLSEPSVDVLTTNLASCFDNKLQFVPFTMGIRLGAHWQLNSSGD